MIPVLLAAAVETMSIWVGVGTGIATLIGVAVSVGRNSQKVTDSVDRLSGSVDRLDGTIHAIDAKVDDHEVRLSVVEDRLSTRPGA